jgi:signal peptidase II
MTTSPAAAPETKDSAPYPAARIVFFIAAIMAAAADLASKWAVFARVASSPDGRIVLWPGRFEFLARFNDAGIWSIGYGTVNSNLVFTVLSCIVIPLVIGWALWTLRPNQRGTACLLGFIVGGAVGNAYDRFVYGGVRDFIQVYLWNDYAYPIFNVADSFLVCSVATLILGQWWTGRAEAKRQVALAS